MTLDLSRPWTDLPVCVLDFETTGPDPETCEPVEVSAIRFENGVAVSKFTSFIDHGVPIPEEATKIHGITTAMIAGAPSLVMAASSLAKVAAGAIPCAFNEPFDRRVLHRSVVGTDVPMFDPDQRWLDVFVMVASPLQDKYVSGSGRLKLGAACERRGIVIENAHRAEADALATGRLLYAVMGDKRPTLGALLDRMAVAREEQDRDWMQWRIRKWTETATMDELRAVTEIVRRKAS